MASQWARAWSIAGGLIRSAADQALDHADDLAQSQADALWERAFDDLNRHFARLAALVQAEFNVGWSIGGTAGEDWDYPLHWWAEFSSSSSWPVTVVGRCGIAVALPSAARCRLRARPA